MNAVDDDDDGTGAGLGIGIVSFDASSSSKFRNDNELWEECDGVGETRTGSFGLLGLMASSSCMSIAWVVGGAFATGGLV